MPTSNVTIEAPGVTNYIAAKTLSGQRLMIVTITGSVTYASSSNLTHIGRMVGLSLNAATKGERVAVQRAGRVVDSSWNWQISKTIFLSTEGFIIQAPPLTGFVLPVGVAVAKDAIMLANIQAVQPTILWQTNI